MLVSGGLDSATCLAIAQRHGVTRFETAGSHPGDMIDRIHDGGGVLIHKSTQLRHAVKAAASGVDAVTIVGMEAGGHRGAFNADDAARSLVGLFSLLPAVVDAVDVPVVATGGIADARTIAAAFVLGASAVQIGTGLLRTPEAGIAPAWADAIGAALPEGTVPTRAFSGRLGL